MPSTEVTRHTIAILQVSQPVPLGHFAQMCRLLVQCRTLGEALRTGLAYYHRVLPDFVPRLVVHDGQATVRLVGRGERAVERGYADRTFCFFTYGLASWLVARRIPVLEVMYRPIDQGYSSDAGRLFQAPVAGLAGGADAAKPAGVPAPGTGQPADPLPRPDQPERAHPPAAEAPPGGRDALARIRLRLPGHDTADLAPAPARRGPGLPGHQGRPAPRRGHRVPGPARADPAGHRQPPGLFRGQHLSPRLQGLDRPGPGGVSPDPAAAARRVRGVGPGDPGLAALRLRRMPFPDQPRIRASATAAKAGSVIGSLLTPLATGCEPVRTITISAAWSM